MLSLLDGENLSRKEIRKLAFDTGFCKRSSGKIEASDFLLQLCLQSLEGTVSYNDLAARIEVKTGTSASRQAYWERTNDSCVRFFQRILERIMHSKCRLDDVKELTLSGRFTRILLQDSTVIRLPLRLFAAFSGIRNAHKTVCNARIQGIYDLLSGRFIKFAIDPYSKNDQSVTLDIPVEPGDLVLRDRGYFTLEALAEHKKADADSINRYKHKTTFYDSNTMEKINMIKLLTKHGSIDMDVLAGTDKNLKVRLVAVPVDEEIANLRRMKAKKEMKGHAPSQDILMLMSWTIFITTITDPAMTFKEIFTLYGLRWRIENIFKTWKSNFNFAKVHNVSEHQLRVLLTARFIMIIIFYQKLYLPLSQEIRKTTTKQLSLMKFMRYIRQNIEILHELLDQRTWTTNSLEALVRYCTYDRRKRVNFATRLENIMLRVNSSRPLA